MLCVVSCTAANAAPREMPATSASCAVAVELNSGRIICGKNENSRASMASTTKIMTSLLLCEMSDLDKEITVTKEMVAVEGTSMGLLEGDKVHYRDLLYGMLLASGNDAAMATAISIGGTVEGFANLMNARAKRIGMKNTHFVTPSGLDDENHYSTAYDMAQLAVTAMKNKVFAKACSTKKIRLSYGNPPYERMLSNHNRLLVCCDGCKGIKTGFTKKSGRCLVSCAKRNGSGVVIVTLRDPNDWDDHMSLYDYCFGQLEKRTLELPELPIINAAGADMPALEVTAKAPTVSLLPEDFDKLSVNVQSASLAVAPVSCGEVLGKINWTLDGKVVASSDITVSHGVNSSDVAVEKNMKYWLRHMFAAG